MHTPTINYKLQTINKEKQQTNMNDISKSVFHQLQQCKAASKSIMLLEDETRKKLVRQLAMVLIENQQTILEANALDLAAMKPENPLYDRLKLTEERLNAMAQATLQVADLSDPSGKKISQYDHPNGLIIERITVPLGVVGAIYEARPNVTVDIAVLCIRSGNAVALKGGSDARHSNACLVEVLHQALREFGLPQEIITLLPPDREAVAPLLTASTYVDVLIPRGSQGLIQYVRQHATVPTIETGAGVCHTYIHQAANLAKAAAIVVNAKTQRPSVCNALDTVLLDASIAGSFLPLIIPGFLASGVKVNADAASLQVLTDQVYPFVVPAGVDSFGKEYLSQECSIKIVNGLSDALAHIAEYSSKHSEAIITEDKEIAEIFLGSVDAAAVYHNASTRFTDGGEFGLGAEMGISTQKLHARGPFALEKLVCEKWIVRGNGQIR